MTQENQPLEELGTKHTNYWYRFRVNDRTFEHLMNSPKLSIQDIMEKFSIKGFSPVTEKHITIHNNIYKVNVKEPFEIESRLIDVSINHPLYNKLY